MRSVADRLIALAKAIEASEQSRQDSRLELGPLTLAVLELPQPVRKYGAIPAGSVVSDSFGFDKGFSNVGAQAGANVDGPIFDKGLWRIRGTYINQFTGTPSVNFGQLILQDPATGALVLATVPNLVAHLVVPIDWLISVVIPGTFLRLSSPATAAGDISILHVSLLCSRLF